ncbi:tyrosine-protein phosphatase [Lactobacillus sp. AN1001]
MLKMEGMGLMAIMEKKSSSDLLLDKLVDLHCHILPEIDDGSPNMEVSVELARKAVANGVTHILATPHHLDRNYINHASDVIKKTELFQNRIDSEKIPLKIFPGQEVHLRGDLIYKLDDILGVDGGKKYILLEFPHVGVPNYSKKIIFELLKRGVTPIIVHPERNREIQKNINILFDLISSGALAQVTATSYMGGFGEKVSSISKKMIEHGLVQVVASDAHALDGREFVLGEALRKISKDFGIEKARKFELNAERLINGQIIDPFNYTSIKKHLFFFRR